MPNTYRWSGGSEEDQRAQIRGTLVAQRPGGIDQGANTVGLQSATNEGRAPHGGSTSGFLGLEEFLFAVGGLGTMVGVTEDRGKDSEGNGVSEDGAEGDGRRLDW